MNRQKKHEIGLKVLGLLVSTIVVVTFLLFIFTIIPPIALWAVLIPCFIIAYWVVPKLKEK